MKRKRKTKTRKRLEGLGWINGIAIVLFIYLFLTDDVIMASTVDAVELKNAAPHDVRYTVAVIHVCEAGGYSVRCLGRGVPLGH